MSTYTTVNVEVDVDFDDIDVDEMIDYLEEKGYSVNNGGFAEEPSDPNYRTRDKFPCEQIAERIKERMLDLDENFMHDFICELAGIPKSSAKDEILKYIGEMI